MSVIEGVHLMEMATLSEICCEGRIQFNREGHFCEFGIRWIDGEISEDVLIVDTDGFYDGPDQIEFCGDSYSLEFGEDLLKDVLVHNSSLPEDRRPSIVAALRYRVEFDAFLEPETASIGGKWQWGGMRGRSEKREPEEFHKRWRKT